jgi:hypothetical protein
VSDPCVRSSDSEPILNHDYEICHKSFVRRFQFPEQGERLELQKAMSTGMWSFVALDFSGTPEKGFLDLLRSIDAIWEFSYFRQ